jgi:hypothetical protein
LGLLFSVLLFGFPLSIPVFILLYLKMHHKPWRISLLVSAISTVVLYGSFQYLLQADLYKGFLFEKLLEF